MAMLQSVAASGRSSDGQAAGQLAGLAMVDPEGGGATINIVPLFPAPLASETPARALSYIPYVRMREI